MPEATAAAEPLLEPITQLSGLGIIPGRVDERHAVAGNNDEAVGRHSSVAFELVEGDVPPHPRRELLHLQVRGDLVQVRAERGRR